ncbi:hypothetical protein CBP51_15155 [Cellvibrio mixtus]|uniref:Curli production assembly/transport component CsgG n=1 Tax=Cellvibrio mixtus TaxID=39650 RepID=A0A266Q570_9GAMM|nr:hypothetical protein [Cellvibrio mixtus]OZY84531.1 hypothetical protein CBP51_15155 [Cellvibrio mixtus]
MLKISNFFLVFMFLSCGAYAAVKTGDLKNVEIPKEIPSLASKKGEVYISQSYRETDPGVVLGSIVDTQTGEVLILESFLVANPTPKIERKTELVYKNLVTKEVAAGASYLTFISTTLNAKTKAEVTITKNAFVGVSANDIDKAALREKISNFSMGELDRYGIIIGYTDYTLLANTFSEIENKTEAGGYGAKIDGKWHNRSENILVERSVVALYSPLKILVPSLAPNSSTPLKDAIKVRLDAAPLPDIKAFEIEGLKRLE